VIAHRVKVSYGAGSVAKEALHFAPSRAKLGTGLAALVQPLTPLQFHARPAEVVLRPPMPAQHLEEITGGPADLRWVQDLEEDEEN